MNVPFADVPGWFAVRKGPDAVAVRQGDEQLTWSALEARSTQRAHAFSRLGVRSGDFVAVGLPRGLEFFETTFAVWKLGATVAPVPNRLPVGEAGELLARLKPALLVGGDRDWGEWPRFAAGADVSGEPVTAIDAPIARHWAAIPSGGSTGRPKWVVQHMLAVTGVPYRVPAGLASGQRILNPGAPLYHAAPFLITHWGLFQGCEVVSMATFDAEAVLREVQTHRITWLYLVPTMMHRIWALPPEVRRAYDLSSLEFVVHTAAPIPPWLKQAWIDWLGPEKLIEHYGGSENFGGVTISGADWLAHKGSVGRADPNLVRILDANRNAVGPDTVGEVHFRAPDGPGSTFHYIGAEPRRTPEGWESFGDFGHLDKDGYLFLADRREDMIIRAGANIFPAEIEAALLAHPDVKSCAVIGLPDDDLGQRIHAIVELEAHADIQAFADAADAFLQDRLIRQKHPASFEAVQEPLRDAAGKVRRSGLAAERLQWRAAGRPFETTRNLDRASHSAPLGA